MTCDRRAKLPQGWRNSLRLTSLCGARRLRRARTAGRRRGREMSMGEAEYRAAPFKPPPLAELPPLEVLSPESLAALEDELSWIALPGGQILFHEGEAPDSLYLVTTGLLGVIVTTPEQGQQLVAEIHAGETIGEMSLITGDTHSATVVALRHSEFYRMPKAVFDRLVADEPKFLAWITRLVVQRLHRTTKRTKVARRASVALVPL